MAALASASCADVPTGDAANPSEELASSEHAILNASTPASRNLGTQTLLHISHVTPQRISCSGVLLRNNIALTAKRCVTVDGLPNGALQTDLSRISVNGVRSEQVAVATIIPHPSVDAALLFLKQPVATATNTYSTLSVSLYPDADSTLVSKQVQCYGDGVNILGASETDPYAPGTATLTVSSAQLNELKLAPSPWNQIQYKRDEGGACFTTPGLQLAGIYSYMSTSGSAVTGANLVSIGGMRDWLNSWLGIAPRAFSHGTVTGNLDGNMTVLDGADINGNPNALLYVTPMFAAPIAPNGMFNNHVVGVFYSQGRWRIFNEDKALMESGQVFNVARGGGYVHTTNSQNMFGGSFVYLTQLDHPSLNGHPEAAFTVTHNFNPGGVGGTFDNHPLGVLFDASRQRWMIFHTDLAAMPVNSSYNVWVGDDAAPSPVRVQGGSIEGNMFVIPSSSARWFKDPNMKLFVTPTLGVANAFTNQRIGVFFDARSTTTPSWKIFNQNVNVPMNANVAFHVVPMP